MPPLSAKHPIVVPADVLFTEVDSASSPQGMLLNLATRQYYSLNTTALFIWKQLAAGIDPTAVSEQLTREFAVDPETARTCVLDLVSQLEEAKLLSGS